MVNETSHGISKKIQAERDLHNNCDHKERKCAPLKPKHKKELDKIFEKEENTNTNEDKKREDIEFGLFSVNYATKEVAGVTDKESKEEHMRNNGVERKLTLNKTKKRGGKEKVFIPAVFNLE